MKQTLMIALKQLVLDVVTSKKFQEGVSTYVVNPMISVADKIKKSLFSKCK